MSMTHDARTDSPRTEDAQGEALRSTPPTTDGWTPEDRAPSAAENNFMSFALFGFLIIFGIGCLVFL